MHWTTDGDNYRMDMSLTKVDTEQRLVTGWASLDNPDLQGDIVLAEASEKAFANFRGNIREMHQPIAVGRMVSYRPDSYYDTETQKFYNGIVVTAYISKGAQDTWEKVLDGTLQAFSIKGPIIESDMEFSKDAGHPLRIIKEYALEELSLVDSGGNQLANIMSITKSVDGGVTVSGMVAETQSENVFWCGKHDNGIAKTSSDETAECPDGHRMQNIGWFETEGTDKAEKVAGIIDSFLSTTSSANAEIAKQEEPANNEGGVDVVATNEENTTEVEAGTGAPVSTDAVAGGAAETEVEHSVDAVAENVEVDESETETDSETEKAADVSEVADEPDLAKMFTDLQSAIQSGLEKNASDAQVALAEISKSFEAKFDELVKSHSALEEKISGLKSNLDDVEKSLRSVESETAVRKSGDLGGSMEDTITKGNGFSWGGTFSAFRTNELD